MNIKYLILLLICLHLISCGKTNVIKPLSKHEIMAQHLVNNQLTQAKILFPKVALTENAQNLIGLNIAMHEGGELPLMKEVEYIEQFFHQMSFVHQSMFNQIVKWLFLKQIYRQEIKPPVRILQREQLYLAPSGIDFDKCLQIREGCSNELRKKLLVFMTITEINKNLISMASKDSCVNLSSRPKGEAQANRCLRMSKGKLSVTLLAKPKFSFDEWLQVIIDE